MINELALVYEDVGLISVAFFFLMITMLVFFTDCEVKYDTNCLRVGMGTA